MHIVTWGWPIPSGVRSVRFSPGQEPHETQSESWRNLTELKQQHKQDVARWVASAT